MKYTLIALTIICSSMASSAQKHSLFADVGFNPGFSVTYNYKLLKRIGVGVGVQGYRFSPTLANTNEFTPAVFADLRFKLRPGKANQFFTFLDLGIDLYKSGGTYIRDNSSFIYNVAGNNGFYTGLGFGYLRRMTKRGGGPYASLKLIMNWCKVDSYHTYNGSRQAGLLTGDGTLALSLGFKI